MSKNYVKSKENEKYNYLGVVSKLGEALLLWKSQYNDGEADTIVTILH